MCLIFTCDEDERVIGSQQAPGSCPFCGGEVAATDVESEWRFCFVPLYSRSKRRFHCMRCGRRLVSYA